jgi:hypothetical protein
LRVSVHFFKFAGSWGIRHAQRRLGRCLGVSVTSVALALAFCAARMLIQAGRTTRLTQQSNSISPCGPITASWPFGCGLSVHGLHFSAFTEQTGQIPVERSRSQSCGGEGTRVGDISSSPPNQNPCTAQCHFTLIQHSSSMGEPDSRSQLKY